MPQNKNKIKSEYSQSFRTYKDRAQTEYNENFKFRLARRDREVSHQPWAWLDLSIHSEDDDNEQNTVSVECPDKQSTGESDETDSNFDASCAVDRKDVFDHDNDTLVAKLKERAMKKVKEMKYINIETQNNISNNTGHRPHHPIKGNKDTFQPRRNIQRKSKKSNENEIKTSMNNIKPFLSYGWGSKSQDNGHKKTFNINSDIDVYPSAIRALKHIETRKQVANDDKNNRPKTADPNLGNHRKSCRSVSSARSMNLDNKSAVEWLSEYQQRYPTYNNDVYRRCLANLAPRGQHASLDSPRTCRI